MIFITFFSAFLLLSFLVHRRFFKSSALTLLMCTKFLTYALIAESSPRVININNVGGLNIIGRHASHPADGNYQLTDSFNASDFENPIKNFRARINGNCNTLTELRTCLAEIFSGTGVIHDITFYNANLTSSCPHIISKKMEENAMVAGIIIDHGYCTTK